MASGVDDDATLRANRVMGNCGTTTVADITRAYVATPEWRL
jgi:hypothetical protein